MSTTQEFAAMRERAERAERQLGRLYLDLDHVLTPILGTEPENGTGEGLVSDVTIALDRVRAERDALTVAMQALADWHDTKADKALRFRPEIDGRNDVMDKASAVHSEAAWRLRRLLDDGDA